MAAAIEVLRVIHVLTAILMAWPLYALVIVNQRAVLGPPLGDRADAYLENIIKNRSVPCFVFQAIVLISGLALALLRGLDVEGLVANPVLVAKLLLLLLIGGLLGYVHSTLQPRIDALFSKLADGQEAVQTAERIGALRLRRKRLASVCLFSVLTMAMLGLQVWSAFPLWLTGLLVLAIAAFTWRAFRSVTPYGWV